MGRALGRLFSFRGRDPRAAFWMTVIGAGGVFVVLFVFIDTAVGRTSTLVLYPPFFWLTAAAAVRRLHDRGRSAWFLLILVIPIVGLTWLAIELCADANPQHDRRGSPRGERRAGLRRPHPRRALARIRFRGRAEAPVDANGFLQTRFTRRLLQHFIANPETATDERVAVYQRPLVARGATAAIGAWLPELLDPPQASASEDPATYAGISRPVVATWGASDSITPLPQGERLVKLLPHARLETMPRVGHIPQIESPAALNALLVKTAQSLDN
jgi:pimeloyl-ACP methyl ester carboxylesterase